MAERPKVKVRLVGEDGNAYAILGRVSAAMRRAGWDRDEIEKYAEEATSGDYNHLLSVTLAHATDIGSYDEDDYDEDEDDYDEEDE